MGIEPTSQAWEAGILPMNYTRISLRYYSTTGKEMQEEFFDVFPGAGKTGLRGAKPGEISCQSSIRRMWAPRLESLRMMCS